MGYDNGSNLDLISRARISSITSGVSAPPPDVQKPPAEATAIKANATGLRALWNSFMERIQGAYQVLGKGEVKIVWIKRTQIPATGVDIDKTAYYTPVRSFLNFLRGNKTEKELKAEAFTMQRIDKKLEGHPHLQRHLAVKVREVEKHDRINGQYTLEVERATDDDFEKRLRNKETPMKDRIAFGGHLLQGLTGLHHADYVHGDMKPENCLIYKEGEQEVLKISDFGKAKLLGDKVASYSGNTRFAPPEGTLSKKGDVYGAALQLIRNFEESVFQEGEDSLRTVQDKDSTASKKLRGIEKYVVENKAFLAANPGLGKGTFRRLQLETRTPAEKTKQTEEMHKYIDTLTARMEAHIGKEKADGLNKLLKKMTHEDPNKRISAKEASVEYHQIFSSIKPKI